MTSRKVRITVYYYLTGQYKQWKHVTIFFGLRLTVIESSMSPHILAKESTSEKVTGVYKMNPFQIQGNYQI